ncbi:MAG TPA: tripartite tricarboxylate transporter substrate binding protein [Beijerinckiaceae bacterium]|nr:tripartite tricarboxylate transporter substrate binding protein [Beijerinckiaceae bacterium]
MRRFLAAAAVLAAGALALPAAAADYPWKPDRPVTLIVPWAAGGSTDQMARIVATEIEAELKQKVVVVNQPGASGSVGTKGVLEGAKDGYTWAAGAAVDIGGYKVLGLLDSQLKDWHLFFAVANVNTVSANPNAPFKDFGQFLETLKKNGKDVPVATAGLSSAGHNMMETIRKAAPGVEYRHVTYDGGNPAVLSAVSGETQAASQLLVEMSEFIKGKRLVPLAVQADKPVTLEGFGEIPPVTKWLPNMPTPLNYFGIWAPKGTPEPVVQTMEMIWKNKIANSEALKKYAAARAALFTPLSGADAERESMKMLVQTAWLYFDAGKAKVSPETIGIPRPQ